MSQDLIFYPMGALAALTFLVFLLIPIRRFGAIGRGQLTAEDFRFGESSAVPGEVSLPNRAMMNLLELPVLFYVAGLMYFVAGKVDAAALAAAWAFVGFRVLQAAIHVTYNNVRHRMLAFAGANLALVAFWAMFFLR